MKTVRKKMEEKEVQDIFNWCDRWCEKCSQTELCTLYKSSLTVTPEEVLMSLPKIFETVKKMLKKTLDRANIDPDSLTKSDFEDEYEWETHLLRKDDIVVHAKKYRKKVTRWFDSLNDDYGMEVRMQDSMMTDCIDVILWYQSFFEIKIERALISKKEEEDGHSDPYDSLGTAKLLLVSIERNIEAWGYMYQKFKEDEDAILEILINLQNLSKKVEQIFPEARAFIRPGLD